jgi:hypothetical protein
MMRGEKLKVKCEKYSIDIAFHLSHFTFHKFTEYSWIY